MAPASGHESRAAAADEELEAIEVDTSVAHPARIWDCRQGGKGNFAPDRVVGDAVHDAARTSRTSSSPTAPFSPVWFTTWPTWASPPESDCALYHGRACRVSSVDSELVRGWRVLVVG